MHVVHGREFANVAELRARIAELDAAHPGRRFPQAVADEWNALNASVEEVELETRHERVRQLAADPRNLEAGTGYGTTREELSNDPRQRSRDEALRAIERHTGILEPQAADRLDNAVRGDRLGLDAAYIAAVADPSYNRAFGKILAHGAMAPMRFTPDEQESVQAVNRAEEMRAALAVGAGATGGFAVPFELDPTILNTSSGALNAIPQLARNVELMGSNEWRGISSAGVTSNYGAEGSEVADDAPTLAQPTIRAERWTSFVPFSIEIGQDWASLQADLGELMRDAKATLDATKFISGTGVSEPGGVLNVGGTGGLTTTQRVLTATIATFAAGDVYLVKQALPPRFQPNASYVMAPATVDVVYRFVPAGSTTEAPLLSIDRTRLIGRAVHEQSTLSSATTTTGSRIIVVADWQQAYAVVTRIGVQVELVNHLFGTGRRPSGERGLLAIGRTGAGVINASAARYLEVK